MRPPEAGGHAPAAPDTVDRAAARAFRAYLGVIGPSYRALAADGRPDALHALRVALRRFRAALRFFRPALNGPAPADLDGRLDTLTTELGPVRDLDVWLGFLAAGHLPERLAHRAGGRALAAAVRRQRDREAALLAARLRDPAWGETLGQARIFLQDLEQSRDDPAPSGDFGDYAAPCVEAAWRRFRARAGTVRESSPPARCHALRKAARRARYFTEIAQPAFHEPMARFVTGIHAVATALGQVHDMDVFLQHAAMLPGEPGARLRSLIQRHRHEHWLAYRQVLSTLPSSDSLGKILVRRR